MNKLSNQDHLWDILENKIVENATFIRGPISMLMYCPLGIR